MSEIRADRGALKVVFLFIGMPVGGAEDFALGVYPHLLPGVSVRFVCLRELGMLGEEAMAAGYPVDLMPLFPTKRINPLAVWKFARWLREQGIDVVHSQTYHAHLFGVCAARMAGISAIMHQQKTLGQMPWRKKFLFRSCLRGAKKILTLSERTRQEIAQEFSVSLRDIEVVPNAIDSDVFTPADDKLAVRKSLGLPEHDVLFGTVASLHSVKNHKVIIRALALLTSRRVRPKAVFVGDGAAREELEKYAREQGVSDQIIFAGRRRPSVSWFQAFDVFVLASFWEGQALALLQAVSCGLPVLVSRVEGNIAVLGENHDGYFEPDDFEKLAQLLENSTKDKPSRDSYLAHGTEIPTCRHAALQLERIYHEVA